MRFFHAAGIHEEDDAVLVFAHIPLVDFSAEVKANRIFDLSGHDGFPGLGGHGCHGCCDLPDGEYLGCRNWGKGAWLLCGKGECCRSEATDETNHCDLLLSDLRSRAGVNSVGLKGAQAGSDRKASAEGQKQLGRSSQTNLPADESPEQAAFFAEKADPGFGIGGEMNVRIADMSLGNWELAVEDDYKSANPALARHLPTSAKIQRTNASD
jgi:hypothetical protein